MPEAQGPQLHRLSNGLRLIVEARPGAGVCAVAVTVGGGSRLDPLGRAGLAHMVEHLMFRQSPVGAGHMAAVHQVGGVCNATTHLDHTVYHSLVPDELLDEVLTLEAKRFTAPTATAATVDAERPVISREIAEALAQSRNGYPWIPVPASLFRSPDASRPPHGDPAELPSITAADCERYLGRQYVPDNIVVSVVGGCRADEVADTVAARFGELPARWHSPAREHLAEPGSGRIDAEHAAPVPDGMALTAVGLPTPDAGRDRAAYLELALLAQILSAHHLPALRSRLPGLVHAAMSVGYQGRWLYCRAPDLAVCQLVHRTDPSDDVVGHLDRALRYVRDHDVTERQREWAVTRLRLAHYQEIDDPLRCALALGQHEVLGFGWDSFTGLGEELSAMTDRPLREAAARLLDGRRAVVRVVERKEPHVVH